MAFFRKGLSESTRDCLSYDLRFIKAIKNKYFGFGTDRIGVDRDHEKESRALPS